ncbi:tyrosine-type recombinase/integrase [Bradyrhizobium sp. USDA 372]
MGRLVKPESGRQAGAGRRWCTADGCGRMTRHALRHACASLWIENGHNPKQIQCLMGHSSIKVTI